jgi:recombinational DNA repair protein RecT
MIRRLSKLLPKSVELANAIAVDGGIRVDVRGDADPATATEQPVMEGVVVEDETGGADPDADPTLSPDQWPAVRQPGDAS